MWPTPWNKCDKPLNVLKQNIKQTCNNCVMNCSTPKHSNKQPKLRKSAAYWTNAPRKNAPNASKPNANGNESSPANNKRQQRPLLTSPGVSVTWNTNKPKAAENKHEWPRPHKAPNSS